MGANSRRSFILIQLRTLFGQTGDCALLLIVRTKKKQAIGNNGKSFAYYANSEVLLHDP